MLQHDRTSSAQGELHEDMVSTVGLEELEVSSSSGRVSTNPHNHASESIGKPS